MASVRGIFRRDIYYDRGWGILAVDVTAADDLPDAALNRRGEVRLVGEHRPFDDGTLIQAEGYWTNSDYGLQLTADYVIGAQPADHPVELSAYIRGIIDRPELADRLVRTYGRDALTFIRDASFDEFVRLGVSAEVACQMQQRWNRQHPPNVSFAHLVNMGLQPESARSLVEEYGSEVSLHIYTDPYQFCVSAGSALTFRQAEAIAQQTEHLAADNSRIYAAALHLIRQAEQNGDTCLTYQNLLTMAEDRLGISKAELDDELLHLRDAGKLTVDIQEQGQAREVFIYRNVMAQYENRAATRLQALATTESPVTRRMRRVNAANYLNDLTACHSVTLTDEQQSAVLAALTDKVSVLTGGPGTGKTTTLQMLIRGLHRESMTVELAAPTGKAAKRMTDSIGEPAQTIHRLLDFDPETGRFRHHGENPLFVDAVVIDEASMIDTALFAALVQALPDRAHLVLVGDVDQLPSVGPGNVLQDVIQAPQSTVTRLSHVFRQCDGSHIVSNACAIIRGDMNALDISNQSEDFFYFARRREDDIGELIIDILLNRLQTVRGNAYHPVDDVQIIAPTYASPAGIHALNATIQERVNPPGEHAELATYQGVLRVGDRVIQTENNYDVEVYNGDTGKIVAIDPADDTVTVAFDDEQTVTYPQAEAAGQLMLSYAISVHRSQGSEYPIAIVPVAMSQGRLLVRNLLYTAVTRAREMVCLVGQQRAIEQAVQTAINGTRRTGLLRKLRDLSR